MDEVVESRNMENVCRLCLSTDGPKASVFGVQETLVSLAAKIQACLSIQILATDRLPTQICAQCVKNVNQWHNYKEVCLRSQDKLHQWLEKQLQTSPMVVTIKDEPVDLDFYEDNIEVISETTHDTELDSCNFEESMNNLPNNIHIQEITDDEMELSKDKDLEGMNKDSEMVRNLEVVPPIFTKDIDVSVKPEPPEECDTDCTIEIESITSSELLLNPLSNKEDRIMEADSTQKSIASGSTNKRKGKRRFHTHYRGARIYKQKCVYCQINLHSKYTYIRHMERFHSNKENGNNTNTSSLQDGEELVEDVEDELMSMEKDAPLTQVQQNIIGQLKTFSCYACQQTFSDRKSTLSHIRQHMPDLRPYTCIACLTEFPDRSMYKLHCGASFECAMKIALVIPKQGEQKYFTCSMCLRSLPNRKELLSHLSKHSDRQYEQLVSPARSPPKLQPMASLSTPKLESVRKSLDKALMNIPSPYKNGDPAYNHECDLCGMIYRYKPNMLKHRDLCQRLLPDIRTSYRCVHCGMTFLVFQKFHAHMATEHKKKDFICSQCNAKFKNASDYLSHHETHRGDRNKKQLLDKKNESFKSPQNISTPVKDWDKFEAEVNAGKVSDSNQYSCALCNLEFGTRSELTEHRNLHLKVKIYSCVICRSMFSSAGALEVHMKDHGIEDPNERNANSSCVEYGKMEQESQDKKPLNVSASSDPGTTKNECDLCGKIFSNYANMRRHIKNIHKSGKRNVSCPQCPRMFKSKEICDRHIMTEHKPAKPMHQCPQCPKSFVFQANLNLHFHSAHGEKSRSGHKCDICGKVFAEESSLKIHRTWHSRPNSRLNPQYGMDNDKKPIITPKQEQQADASIDRPPRARKSFPSPAASKSQNDFQCQVCNNTFDDVTELRKHLWEVHCARNKTEKIFTDNNLQCQLCSNVMPHEEALAMHMEWHKAHPIFGDVRKQTFPCDVCGKLYSSKKVLTRHKKLHKATTAATSKLSQMSKRYEVNNQLHCSICRKVFSSPQSLQRHRLTLHSDLYNERSQSVYNNARKFTEDGPRPKKIKLEHEDMPQKMNPVIDPANGGKKSVMCHVCRKFFPNMSVLYKHKQLMHNKSRVVKNIAKSGVMECIPLPGNNGKVCCNVCLKEFLALPHLRQHFTIKHKNSPPKYACHIDGCKLMFPTPRTLKNHELSHTSTIFCCKACDKHVFSRPAMSSHMMTSHNTVYDAEKNKSFHREADLSTYSIDGVVDATCPRCKIKYPNNKAMKIHYFKFHDGEEQA